MSGQGATRTGGCLCGAVRFTAVPAKPEFDACHCSTCRRWSAGPFLSFHCEGAVTVEDASKVAVYRSSGWAERHFCRTCGTSLFYKLVGRDYWSVSVEALDDAAGLAFASQIFIDEKPGYYAFADDTEMMTGAEVFAAASAAGGNGNG